MGINVFSSSKLMRQEQSTFQFLRSTTTSWIVFIFVSILLIGISYYQFIFFDNNQKMWVYPVIAFSFIWNNFLLISSLQYKPFSINKKIPTIDLKTAIVVPVYNEDQLMFKKMLDSLANQTVKPDVVYIVEDGSKKENQVDSIVESWKSSVPFKVVYRYIKNSGKRVAQSYAFKEYQDQVDIFITIDSDTVLDKLAIEEGIIPFQDSEVMSVAGLLLSENKTNWISKLLSVSFPASFTNGRASSSVYNSVSVSCGGLAFYRSSVINKFLDEYLNQFVFGQRAMFGDDRMLTHYASLMGKTVYQETAIGYTLMPENISHLTRQRVRWWKSFWWGGMFIIRYHSFKHMIWWLIAFQYVSQLLYFVIFPFVMIIYPIRTGSFPWHIILYMIILGYMRSARLLSIKTNSKDHYISLLKFLLYNPLSTIFNIYLGTILSYYGFFMMTRVQGWGTRQDVEVKAND